MIWIKLDKSTLALVGLANLSPLFFPMIYTWLESFLRLVSHGEDEPAARGVRQRLAGGGAGAAGGGGHGREPALSQPKHAPRQPHAPHARCRFTNRSSIWQTKRHPWVNLYRNLHTHMYLHPPVPLPIPASATSLAPAPLNCSNQHINWIRKFCKLLVGTPHPPHACRRFTNRSSKWQTRCVNLYRNLHTHMYLQATLPLHAHAPAPAPSLAPAPTPAPAPAPSPSP